MSTENGSGGGDAVAGGHVDGSDPPANSAEEHLGSVEDPAPDAPGGVGQEDTMETDMVVDEQTNGHGSSPTHVPETGAGEAHDAIHHPADDAATAVVQLELLSPASSDIPPEIYVYPLAIEVREFAQFQHHLITRSSSWIETEAPQQTKCSDSPRMTTTLVHATIVL